MAADLLATVTEADLGRILAVLAHEASGGKRAASAPEVPTPLLDACRERLGRLATPGAVDAVLEDLQGMRLADSDQPLAELLDLFLILCVRGLPEGRCDLLIRYLNQFYPAFLAFSETMRSFVQARRELAGKGDGGEKNQNG